MSMSLPKFKVTHLLLAGIVAASFLIRFRGIGWGFIFDQKLRYDTTIHDDEKKELRAISQMRPAEYFFGPLDAQREGPLHPYLIAAGLFAAEKIGYVNLSPQETFYREHPQEMRKLFLVGRFLTLCIGLGEIIAVFFIGNRLFSPLAGILAATLLAFIPIEVVQSTYFRSYTLANFFMLVGLYAALRIAEEKKYRWWLLGAGAVGFTFSTRISMLPAFLFLPAAVWYRIYTQEVQHAWPPLRTLGYLVARSFRPILLMLAICIGAVILSNPYWLIKPRAIWHEMNTYAGYTGNRFDIRDQLYHFGIAFTRSIPQAMTVALYIFSLAGLVLALVRKHRLAFITLGFIAVYAYAVFGNVYATIPRLTMPLMPLFALFSGYAAGEFFSGRLPGRHGIRKIGLAMLLTASIGYAVLYDVAHMEAARRTPTLANVSAWIEKHISPGDSIGITWRHAHFKELDFDRYKNVVELTDLLSGLEKTKPRYLILFSYICCDFYQGTQPQDVYQAQLTKYGYQELIRFPGETPRVGPFVFANRIDRLLEYETRIYMAGTRESQ